MRYPALLAVFLGLLNSQAPVGLSHAQADTKAQPLFEQQTLFKSGDHGYHKYRIPALAISTRGTVLAFCEGSKKKAAELGNVDLVLRRSVDGGKTWGAMQVLAADGAHAMGNPCPVVDRNTDIIWLPLCRDYKQVFMMNSADDGQTWSKAVEITKNVMDPAWHWIGTGSGHGIQLRNGRLLIPGWADAKPNLGEVQFSFAFFSDDAGKTWRRGNALDLDASDECQAVELDDGTLYMTLRSRRGKYQRGYALSKDGGQSWSPVQYDPRLPEPSCQGSVIRFTSAQRDGQNRILLAAPVQQPPPAKPDDRSHLTIRLSLDECRSWPISKVVHPAPSAYSDLAVTNEREILLLYEADDYSQLTFARFNLAWITDGKPAADVRPFTIHVADAALDDLRQRLARTRFPDQIDKSAWDYGVDLAYMKELVQYWRTKYDWRKWERRLNQFDQFKTTIDGLDIHFLHVRSKEKNATPLLLVHGWPGSFVEFYKVIGPLTDPVAHGGKAEDAFHVVIPSLPGFGFSGKPSERGWSNQRMAETMAKLMARLGYNRYGAQGGDWGSGITLWLATNDGAHCIGGHSNFPPGGRPQDDPMRGVTPKEMERFEQRVRELADQRAYGAIQGSRPLTLGYALNDSPAGLAAWMVDKFFAWSDHGGNLEKSFSKDELLTNAMIYWLTETMSSSTRIYYESSHNNPRPPSMAPLQSSGPPAPVGFALFPKEINVPPRAWPARIYGKRLIHWTEMPRGGHFAALETPELLVQDVRAFFREVRDRR